MAHVRPTALDRDGHDRRRSVAPCSRPGCSSIATIPVEPGETYCLACAIIIADREARAACFARDGHRCRSCGREGVEWAHVLSRRSRYLRWSLDNALALCRACHERFTREPVAWRAFVNHAFGNPDHLDGLMRRRAGLERQGWSVDLGEVIRGFRLGTMLTPSEREAYREGAW